MSTDEPAALDGGRSSLRKDAAPFAERQAAVFSGGAVEVRPLPELAAAIERMRDRPVQASVVRFSPSARTVAHRHTGDQILVVLGGEGTISGGDTSVHVRAGDVVVVLAEEVHVHAPKAGRGLTHLSLLFGTTKIVGDPYPTD